VKNREGIKSIKDYKEGFPCIDRKLDSLQSTNWPGKWAEKVNRIYQDKCQAAVYTRLSRPTIFPSSFVSHLNMVSSIVRVSLSLSLTPHLILGNPVNESGSQVKANVVALYQSIVKHRAECLL
jgi:hypothetical protein